MYILALSAEKKMLSRQCHSRSREHTQTQILVSKLHSSLEGTHIIWRKKGQIQGWGREEYKLSLEFLFLPESKEVPQNDVEVSKGHGIRLKKLLTGSVWYFLSKARLGW